MKKNYFLLLITILLTSLSFGQQAFGGPTGPIITMISDGDCAGGNPKVLEIYAIGTVDFTLYSLENQTNMNTTWGNALDLSALGTVTDAFVYVYKESTAGLFVVEFPGATTVLEDTGSTMNVNGDDRVRIIHTASTNVVDQYGLEGTDGTGTAWEYKDGYAKRNDATVQNAGTFVPGNWTNGNDLLNGFGACQSAATFESIIGIGTYVVTGTPDPTITITSPNNGSALAPGTTSVDIVFSTANLVGGETVDIDVDGTVTTGVTSPFAVATTDGSTYNVTVNLMNGGASVADSTVGFSVSSGSTVADLGALRTAFATQTAGTVYTVTGEVFINYETSFRHQKFIQDANAGILIDDSAGNITSGARGDGLTGITGTVSEYNGMMQFTPTADATLVSPSSLTITPQVVTLATLTTNAEDYESELVKVENVLLDTATNATYINNTDYPMTQGADAFTFRTFYGVDYTTTNVPTTAQDIVALVLERSSGHNIGARDLADITTTTASVNNNQIAGFNMYPNPINDGKLTINTLSSSTKDVELYNVLGKMVFNSSFTGNTTELVLGKLNAGIYILKVQEGTKVSTSKLVIR